MTISLRRIEWTKKLSSISLLLNLVFGAHFCSKASHGQCCTYGLKTTLKLLVHVLAIMANSYLKIVFSQKSGLKKSFFLEIGSQIPINSLRSQLNYTLILKFHANILISGRVLFYRVKSMSRMLRTKILRLCSILVVY